MYKVFTRNTESQDIVSISGQCRLNIINANTLVLDLDGTLRKGDHRLHLLPSQEEIQYWEEKGTPNAAWEDFNGEAANDAPLYSNIAIANRFYCDHTTIVLTSCTWTEENEKVIREQLSEWNVKYDMIVMRHPDNHLHPVEMKEAFINDLTEIVEVDEILAMDDCSNNCEMFNRKGVTTLKVYY